MRKNNLLMSAYIAFVILCFVVRIYHDEFPMWNAIVAAVTISSAFFAYADFFFCYYKALSDACDVADEFIYMTKKRLNAETKSFVEINNLMESIPKGKFDFSEMKETIIPIQNKHDEMELWIEVYVNDTQEKRKRAKNNKFLAEMLTFFGFFVFLCILVFMPITSAVVEMQDVLSVLAFAVILLSDLNGTIKAEKLEKDKIKSENAKRSYEECRRQLKKMKKMINKLVKKIEATEE